MKKLLALLTCMAMATLAMAQNDVTVRGQASAGYSTYVQNYSGTDYTAIDASAIGGNLLCVEILLENFDFNFAGWEMAWTFPQGVAQLSTTAADWDPPSTAAAVFTPGDFFTGVNTLQLPVDSSGNITTDTVSNNSGSYRVGMVVTDQATRPQGSAGSPNAGGVLGTLCVEFDLACMGLLHSVNAVLTANETASGEIFADDTAARVAVVNATPINAFGGVGEAVYFGNPSANYHKGDADLNGVVNAADALRNLRRAVLNEMPVGIVQGSADDIVLFDCNCDGAVNAADALCLLLRSVGVTSNRSLFGKRAPRLVADEGVNAMVLSNPGVVAASHVGRLDLTNVVIENVSIADDSGFTLVFDIAEDNSHMKYALLNINGEAQLPELNVSFRTIAGKQGALTMSNAFFQKNNLETFNAVPAISAAQ
jgi:hypothetical protein